MKYQCFTLLLVFMLFLNIIPADNAIAETHDRKITIVALGDSITFGHPKPSTQSFPHLIWKEKNEIIKFGGIGFTSTQLLKAINNDPNFINSLKRADVVTINIGSNDLLQATGIKSLLKSILPLGPQANDAGESDKSTANQMIVLSEDSLPITPPTQEIIDLLEDNLSTIISTVQQHTTAPIILYTLYNPIGLLDEPVLGSILNPIINQLDLFAEKSILTINDTVIRPIGKQANAIIVDAHGVFNGKQTEYILPLDIHPTPIGHQTLAELANEAILKIQPEIQVNTTNDQTNSDCSVTVDVKTNHDMVELKWLASKKTYEDFNEAGTIIENHTFAVTKNGTYTVFAKNFVGNTAIFSFTIDTINQKQMATDSQGQNQIQPISKVLNFFSNGNTPVTSIYYYLAGGFIFLFVGLAVFKVKRKKLG